MYSDGGLYRAHRVLRFILIVIEDYIGHIGCCGSCIVMEGYIGQ